MTDDGATLTTIRVNPGWAAEKGADHVRNKMLRAVNTARARRTSTPPADPNPNPNPDPNPELSDAELWTSTATGLTQTTSRAEQGCSVKAGPGDRATGCSPGDLGGQTSPEDFASLMDDLESRVFDVLPDSTVVYPGHGRDTNLGVERPSLSDWRSRGW